MWRASRGRRGAPFHSAHHTARPGPRRAPPAARPPPPSSPLPARCHSEVARRRRPSARRSPTSPRRRLTAPFHDRKLIGHSERSGLTAAGLGNLGRTPKVPSRSPREAGMRSPRVAATNCPGRKDPLECISWSGFVRYARTSTTERAPSALRADRDPRLPRRPRRRARTRSCRRSRSASSCSTAPRAPRSRRRDLTAEDFGGPELEGCNENLVLTRPDVIRGIHDALPRAPAPTSSRPTPSAARRCARRVRPGATSACEINRAAAALAREAARGYRRRSGRASSPARWARRPRRSRSPAASPSTSCVEHFRVQALGPDRRRRRLPAARDLPGHAQRQGRRCSASSDAFARGRLARSRSLVSATIEPMGTMLAGQAVEALVRLARARATCSTLGLNCATGPEFMTDHLRTLAELARIPRRLRAQRRPARRGRPLPRDAGDARARARALPRRGLAQPRRRLLRHDAGAHRGARRSWRAGKRPRGRPRARAARSSPGIECVELDRRQPPAASSASAPTCIGSRKFKELIVAERVRGGRRDRRARR